MQFKLIIDKTKEETVVVTAHEASPLTEKIRRLVQEEVPADRVAAYLEDEIRMMSFDKIACIIAQEGKTFAVDNKGKQYRLKQRLYELETILPPSFIRINKSAIANETHIERYAVGFGGSVDAVFAGGYREYVSRRCFAEIKRRYHL